MTLKLKYLCLLILICLSPLFLINGVFAENEEELIRVTGIRLQDNKTELNLIVGENEELKAIVFPTNATDRRVYWNNSNPAVADLEINNRTARVISKNPGETLITVTTVDRGFYIVCRVEVIKPVTSIGIEPDNIALSLGEKVETKAWVIPRDATEQGILWESSSPGVVSVNEEGVVQALAVGDARVIARSLYDKNISTYTNVTVYAAALEEGEIEAPVEPVLPEDPVPTVPENNTFLYIAAGLGGLIFLVFLFLIFKRSRRTMQPSEKLYPVPAADQEARPLLVGLSGIFAGQVINFANNQVIIGRDQSAQAVYPPENTEISRKHCTVTFDPLSQQFTLIDTSSNGTFWVSGERLTQNEQYSIEPGDRFSLAESEEIFTVELE